MKKYHMIPIILLVAFSIGCVSIQINPPSSQPTITPTTLQQPIVPTPTISTTTIPTTVAILIDASQYTRHIYGNQYVGQITLIGYKNSSLFQKVKTVLDTNHVDYTLVTIPPYNQPSSDALKSTYASICDPNGWDGVDTPLNSVQGYQRYKIIDEHNIPHLIVDDTCHSVSYINMLTMDSVLGPALLPSLLNPYLPQHYASTPSPTSTSTISTTLLITSTPSRAHILLDMIEISETTPTAITNVIPGKHRLDATVLDYEPNQVCFTIDPGTTYKEIHIDFVPWQGPLDAPRHLSPCIGWVEI